MILYWLKLPLDEQDLTELRNILAKVVEFYDQVVLPLVYRDMEILIPRFIKKIKKLVLE